MKTDLPQTVYAICSLPRPYMSVVGNQNPDVVRAVEIVIGLADAERRVVDLKLDVFKKLAVAPENDSYVARMLAYRESIHMLPCALTVR